jgi:nicotinamide-nucleotide amidase
MNDCLEFTKVDAALVEEAACVMEDAAKRKLSIVTAESCTGGLIAAVLSEAPGAGDWLHGGFVTYTAAQKSAALGVDPGLIEREDVVSEPVARAMAEGALARSPADIAVAITGVAGPATDDDGTPVGTMHFAVARRGGATVHRLRHFGDVGRGACRYGAVREALALLRAVIADEGAAGSSRAPADRSARR